MNLTLRATLVLSATALFAGSATQASAQPVPVAQHTEKSPAPPPVLDQTTFSLNAGATLNAGNTRAYSGNAGGRLGVIRHPHQFTAEALSTLGYSRATRDDDVEQTSANVIGRARYDLFLSRMDALFIAMAPRRDTFAGLNLRLQNQVGYLRTLYAPADAHRLWTEVGYDLTYDVFARMTTNTPVDITDEVNELIPVRDRLAGPITRIETSSSKPDPEIIHSARLFFGYTNLIYPAANLNLGAEILYDFQDSKNIRVNGIAEINTTITGAFKLGVQSRLFFDNVPIENTDPVDAMVAVQLIYTYDSLAGTAAPACDCTAEVNAAKAECARMAAEPAPIVIDAPAAPEAQVGPLEPEPAPAAPVAPSAAAATDSAPATP